MPDTEVSARRMRRSRNEEYERLRKRVASAAEAGGEDGDGPGGPTLWSFEALFPKPVWDEKAVKRDLFESSEGDGKTFLKRLKKMQPIAAQIEGDGEGEWDGDKVVMKSRFGVDPFSPKLDASLSKGMKRLQQMNPAMTTIWRLPTPSSDMPDNPSNSGAAKLGVDSVPLKKVAGSIDYTLSWGTDSREEALALAGANSTLAEVEPIEVDVALTRMVEDRVYGYRRAPEGNYQYDTSMDGGDKAVQFKDGKRVGNPLPVNADLLTYHARRELSRGKVEEAQELYEQAVELDPRDGRAYLGLSRVAQKRRDFTYAKECLQAGVANSVDAPRVGPDGSPVTDNGRNPFLLQALGCLEERAGNIAQAEELFLSACRSRPCHAASGVAVAQLRTRKLRQGPNVGRACYQTAERELRLAGLPPSSHVYTAWASLEYKMSADVPRARELFELALGIDKKCSAARLQLGVMEADQENWAAAKEQFEAILKYDRRNSRALQAYAIMESKRPDGDSREAIDLFERALKAKPRDAGVLQAYALYVAKLGDIDAARFL